MNGRKTGLSENELTRVNGGFDPPVSEEDRGLWEHLLGDIRRALRRADIRGGELHESIERAVDLTEECSRTLHGGKDLYGKACDLYLLLGELITLNDIAAPRARLGELLE